jgi:hypothetical protein
VRRRRPKVDDGRDVLVADVLAWLTLADYQRRLNGDVPSPYREVRQAAERLLTADELAEVDAVVAGDRPAPDPPPGHDPYRDSSPLLAEAGVRFVDGHGWTADPDVVAPEVSRLDGRRGQG